MRGHLQRAGRVRCRCGICWHARWGKLEVQRSSRTPFTQGDSALPRVVTWVRDLNRMRSEGDLAKVERRDATRLTIDHDVGTGGRRTDEKTARLDDRCGALRCHRCGNRR